ncbi:MAG: photosystem II protein PsbQ [Synechococcus sp.]
MLSALRRLASFCLCACLCLSLVACGDAAKSAPTITPDEMAVIRRNATELKAAQERLPELAKLVNSRDWTFTRNLIHGPMQEVGREMLYINQRLLPGDRAEANKLATSLKEGLAALDEAARLQDGTRLQKAYVEVATAFANYVRVIPEQALS